MTADSTNRTVASWRAHGLKVDGVARGVLDRVQNRLGRVVPAELAALYEQSNGMTDYDSEMLRFLPAEEWANAPAPPDGFVVFAEYSVHAHEYAFGPQGEVVLLGGPPHPIAPSIRRFLELYLDADCWYAQ